MLKVRWGYVLRQTGITLLAIYLILLAGSTTGLVNFRLKVFNLFLGLLLVGGWLFVSWVRGDRIRNSGLEAGFALFLGGQVVAALFSQDWRRSLMVLVFYVVYLLVFYRVLAWLRTGWSLASFEAAFLAVGYLIVVFGVDSIVRSYWHWRSIAAGILYAPAYQQRLFVVFGDANLLAAVLNLFVPLAVVMMLAQNKRVVKAVAGIFLFSALFVSYFADSRGALLGTISIFITLLLGWVFFVSPGARQQFDRIMQWLRARLWVVGVLLLVVLGGVTFAANRILSFEGDATHGSVQSARAAFWGAAIETFTESPWVGSGPGTYPTELLSYEQSDLPRPYLHAHSLPLNILAGSGLAGIIGLVSLVIVIVWRLCAQINADSIKQRVHWLAFAAAIVGSGVHMLFDHFIYFFAVGGVLIFYLAALIYLGEDKSTEVEPRSFHAGWLGLAGLFVLGMSLFSLRAHAVHERALDKAADGDWASAVVDFRQAVELDSKNALYWFNLGYAEGVLAEVNASIQTLYSAIGAYETGLALEPDYGINYANLAALYWEAGQHEKALAHLYHAVELLPHNVLLWQSYGVYLIEAGRMEEGYAALVHSLTVQIDSQPVELLAAVDEALAVDDLDGAEAYLIDAWQTTDQTVAIYDGFARLAIAQGEYDLANRYGQAGLWVQSMYNDEKISLLITLGEAALLQGDYAAARDSFEAAYLGITDTTSYGWGAKGWVPYGTFVFQRRTLPLDLLPQLKRLDMSPQFATRLWPLVDLYEQSGEHEKAVEVHQKLQFVIDVFSQN